MNLFFAALFSVFFLGLPAFSQNVNCTIQEFWNQQSLEQTLEVSGQNDDPHGSLQTFELKHWTGYSGFIAIVKGMSVIHLTSPNADFAYTAHGRLGPNSYSSLQVLLPSNPNDGPETGISGVLIQCALKPQANSLQARPLSGHDLFLPDCLSSIDSRI